MNITLTPLELAEFDVWFYKEPHRRKYLRDSPAYLAAREAWEEARSRNNIDDLVKEEFYQIVRKHAPHEVLVAMNLASPARAQLTLIECEYMYDAALLASKKGRA